MGVFACGVDEKEGGEGRLTFLRAGVQDLTPQGKDQSRIDELKSRMTEEQFAQCVRQVDVNLDEKLVHMRSGFLRLFAEAIHARFTVTDSARPPQFLGLEIPQCVKEQSLRMMQCNTGFDAVEFLSGAYEGGVSGEMSVRDMYEHFLRDVVTCRSLSLSLSLPRFLLFCVRRLNARACRGCARTTTARRASTTT